MLAQSQSLIRVYVRRHTWETKKMLNYYFKTTIYYKGFGYECHLANLVPIGIIAKISMKCA